MNWNYIKIALRTLVKDKVNALINIFGLAVGFSVSILIMIYVHHQLSFDTFHEKGGRMYRLAIEGSMADGKVLSAGLTSGDIAQLLVNQVPELEFACRVYSWGMVDIEVGDQRFTGDKVTWVDTAFFRMFTFPLVKGNQELALKEPFTAVLSRKMAKKYFGDEDPVNKRIKISDRDYKVTGIMENVPVNSHLQFDMVASFSSLERPEWNIVERNGISFPTYILMREGASEEQFIEKVKEVANRQVEERFAPYGIKLFHHVQPFGDIYLYSDYSFTEEEPSDITNVYIFSFLAFFIVLIAIFNFINLVTAQSEKRTREIGMRKVLGALRTDLVWQYIGESVIIALIALLLALGLNELLIGPFSNLLEENFSLIYWHEPVFLIGIIVFVLLVGVISGIYPAFYLSKFRPIVVLKGGQHGAGKSHTLRKILVTLQFAITIFLIASLLLLHKQIGYMKKKDLGFDRENVVTVHRLTDKVRNSYESIKGELLQNPDIISVTASQSIPGEIRSLQNSRKAEDDPSSAIMMYENRIRHDYLKTFGMKIIEGRDFDPQMRTDTAAFIINETAVKKLGLTDPIGADIMVWQHHGKVIGVVSDFNYMSLHHEIDPSVFSMYATWFGKISIRMSPGKVKQTMAFIEEQFAEADPNYTFEYTFVDDSFEEMYRKEEHVNNLITAAAILAIIISILGLYALTSFTVRQKVKEIGIRKAMGASVGNVVVMLFRDLSKWVVLGNLIAWPVAFWAVNSWLQSFAFQINIWQQWWLFVIAGLLALAIGSLAMIRQALSAANENPVDALRYE
ncbi:MAG: FtsX-like permease family protein [Bacteroidota bacterium]